jgi:hypothetical protein
MKAVFVLIWGCFWTGLLQANDSTASLVTTGLVFEKSDQIEMRSEDLSISSKQIVVRYEFLNTSDRDITTIVTFPLPEIPTYGDPPQGVPFAFAVKVDGRPVKTKLESKTREVKEGMTNVPVGVLYKYYWTQIFPAGKSLMVEHSYAPVVGTGIPRGEEKMNCDSAVVEKFLKSQSLKLLATAKKRPDWKKISKSYGGEENLVKSYHHFNTFEHIDYILTTGANWKGPIRKFKLTIRLDDPGDLLQTCFEGLTNTGPGVYSLEKRDFTPTQDLNLIFVRRFDPKRPSVIW